jgi:hypothetical protein
MPYMCIIYRYARDVLHWPIVRNATEGQVP